MRKEVLFLMIKHFCKRIFKSKGVYLLMIIWVVLLYYSAYSGVSYAYQNHFRSSHQQMARESWENNPDKHPHRMAHYGTFAFRVKHPLSVFDFGLESYMGNAVFLEAHRQNTVNFSEAGFSTGLLRFGELSMAIILQLILPLIIFFIGYAAISADRENGTLKILLTQGASWKEILFGRSLGLFAIALVFVLPFFAINAILLGLDDHGNADGWSRLAILVATYLSFAFILCLLTIMISAGSHSSKNALLKLLGIWMVMCIMLPRTTLAVGGFFYPTPGKLEFRSAIEEEVLLYGDSHDPEDPHFKAMLDSVLQVHQAEVVADLPFNYGGLVMKEGERISSLIYNKHHGRLQDQYRRQNQFSKWFSVINPYQAIKNISMALCETDFESYVNFQSQAEGHRYKLSQKMNDLQIEYINPKKVSGSEGKKHVVDRAEWKKFPPFQHRFLSLRKAVANEAISLFSIVGWLLFSVWIVHNFSKKAKVG